MSRFAFPSLLTLALLLGAPGCRPDAQAAPPPAADVPAEGRAPLSKKSWTKPSAEELQKKLNATQLEVTQKSGTEPPFRNEYWDNHAPGLYVDVVTGEPLFSSLDKFDSGTGWPSFVRPVEQSRVVNKSDGSHGMARTEVRSAAGDSHLGHVFDDGPAPTGQRYCINAAALRFIPVDKLEAEGYGEYKALFAQSR